MRPTGITEADLRASTAPDGFTIRDPRPGDQGFITSTWLANMREAPAHEEMSRGAFYSEWGALVDRVLDRSETRCALAVDATDLDKIRGWIVWTPVPRAPVLHYVYVRRRHRREGIATALRVMGAEIGRPFVFTCHGPDERVVREWGGVFLALQEFLA